MKNQINISEHAYRLSVLLHDQQICFFSTGEWLNLAAGIESMEYDYARYDQLVGWCGPADEYNDAHSKVYKKYLLSLTRFMYIWSGFESFCNDTLSKTQMKKLGKVKAFTNTINETFTDYSALPCLKSILNALVDEVNKGSIRKHLKSIKCEKSIIEFPIRLVYKIRNEFAHGNTEFPVPEDYGDQQINLSKTIDLSARIVLYNIQLHLLINFGNVEMYPYSFFINLEESDIDFLSGEVFWRFLDHEQCSFNEAQTHLDF